MCSYCKLEADDFTFWPKVSRDTDTPHDLVVFWCFDADVLYLWLVLAAMLMQSMQNGYGCDLPYMQTFVARSPLVLVVCICGCFAFLCGSFLSLCGCFASFWSGSPLWLFCISLWLFCISCGLFAVIFLLCFAPLCHCLTFQKEMLSHFKLALCAQ